MAEINLSDSKGRDAIVSAESVTIDHPYRWIDRDGAQATNRKILRSKVGYDLETIAAEVEGDLEAVADALIDGDPEVDLETFGSFLEETSRVFTDPDRKIVYKITQWEKVHTADGEMKERRPKERLEPNVATEAPLKWTGKLMKKSDVYNSFLIAAKMQINHINGLTYDFLFNMAKELEDSDSLLLLGAGAKANRPLIFRRGAIPYRGFLEGRTKDKSYALILHLSNMELKAPPEADEEKSEKKPIAKKKAPTKKKAVTKKKAPAKKKATAVKKAAKKKSS